MDKYYFVRFCFKKWCVFFITLLIFISNSLVSAQVTMVGRYRPSKPSVASIFVEEIRPIASVDHLFDEKSHNTTPEQPRENFFYIYFHFSRNYGISTFNRRNVRFLINYEIVSDSRKISGSDVKQYIEGENSLEVDVAKLYEKVSKNLWVDTYRGVGIKFKDAYYKMGLNKYSLMIHVSEEGNPSKMGTLTIEPMDVRVKLNRMSNGCSDKVSMEAVRASTTTKSGLDLFYSGTGKDDLDGAPQSVDMRDLASNQINIPLKKIYATKSKNLQIVAHARGYTPSCHELNIPAADGLTLSAAVLERNQKTNGERIPVTISIPQCHVNPFYSMPITLTYSNNAQMDLDGSPQSVKIPAGQSQYQFDVFLKSAVRCAKDLTMTASSSDFQNIASSNISLPASNELKLEAMYHGKQKNVYEHISVLVKMIKCSSNSERNTVIRLCYEGAGAAYLLNPPSTLDLSNELKTISIYLDRQRSLCDASLKIFASADDAAIVSQTITLGSPERKTIVLSTVN
mgnify:CR=1 FL=1